MRARTGVDIVHVPYRGIAEATKDLLGGRIQAMTASIPATLPLVAERRVKVLAVTGAKRAPQLPDVPSWQEEGVADADVTNYWGIVAPAGTSAENVARLNGAVQSVLAEPDVRSRLEREGAEVVAGSPDRLGLIIAQDLARWKKLVADIGMALQ
jgi:tripartite-type tricarboxylate transporter receptor subunit TctC